MKKFLAFLMLMIFYPLSCFAAYPDLCQSFGCYEESELTKEVVSRYGGWAKREAILLSACDNKPSILEIVRYSHPDNGVVSKKVEIGIVNKTAQDVNDYFNLKIICTKVYKLDSNGNVISTKEIDEKTEYDMRLINADEFRLELWMGPVGNASPRVIDELNFIKKNSAPPETLDADLQKVWNEYRS